jgi:hypothetical protein
MHWCMDETLAVLAMIPFIGYFFRKLHAWYHKKMGHTCHEKHCDDVHVEHKFSPYHRDASCQDKMQYVSKEDMEYLRGTPAPLKITIPVTIERDEDVSYSLTMRGVVVGAIVVHGPMTHEEIASRLSHYDVDTVYSTINELVDGGELVLDSDLVIEGNFFK